ncbi:hypothetical protein ACTMU2_28800 [Cupriavidus basilensis]
MPQPSHPTLSQPPAAQPAFAWAGPHPVSPGWFEIRPACAFPGDARPVYDEDLDCITGYHRSFGRTALTHDLVGRFVAIDERREAGLPQAEAPYLAIGALWQPGAFGVTRAGFHRRRRRARRARMRCPARAFHRTVAPAAAFLRSGPGRHAAGRALRAAAYPAAGDALRVLRTGYRRRRHCNRAVTPWASRASECPPCSS